MSDIQTLDRGDWIRRMLGMAIPLDGMGPLKVGPPDPTIDRPSGSTQTKAKKPSGKTKKVRPPQSRAFDGTGITIEQKGGVFEYTAPPPPIRELVFAGGGGKGTALFGAVEALQDGTMDGVKQVTGASVGAITSALLATGITLDELKEVVDSEQTVELITDGTMGKAKSLLWKAITNRGAPLTGDGVREVVAMNMDETLRKRIMEYQDQYKLDNNGKPDGTVAAILKRMDPKLGPTFHDMRDLSKIIPAIKEISVTGTYSEELDLSAIKGKSKEDPKKNKFKQAKSENKNDEGQLFIFDADSVPAMPVALAVQASAAFPFAFKPVDIDLSDYMHDVKDVSGESMKDKDALPWKVRFIDGGVKNNTPTRSSIGNERPLDPIPQERSLNFVFQGSGSASVVKPGDGQTTGALPRPGGFGDRMQDKATGSKNWAAEYGLSVDAQENARDFVVVPLKFAWTKDNGEVVEVDMSGTFNGTLDFDPDPEIVQEIRKRTKAETEERLSKTKEPVTHKFANATQMVMAISMAELETLKDGKPPYPLARTAWKMRTAVAGQIEQAKSMKWPDDKEKLKGFMSAMDELAKGNPDKAAYVAREIHKAHLDSVIDHAGDKDMPKTSVGAAVGLVSEAKKVFSVANRVLKDLIYPKMRDEKPDGASIGLLESAAKELRQAVSWGEVKAQFELMLKHYRGKSDKKRFVPLPGVKGHDHKAFYKQLKRELALVERMMKRG